MNPENEEARRDEMEAISAIYPDEWIEEDRAGSRYSVTLKAESQIPLELRIEFRLPRGYPATEKPVIDLSAAWMSRDDKANLFAALNEIAAQQLGESVLYSVIEKAKHELDDIVTRIKTDSNNDDDMAQIIDANQSNHKEGEEEDETTTSDFDLQIFHGEPLHDRKSTFQAHLSPIRSPREAKSVLSRLGENRKIASATHNIWAYRIVSSQADRSSDSRNANSSVIQDCDDDGETHAGSRLMHLLRIVDARDVMVVVSRWYGGIQLGADRFKHINNVARDLLAQHNYITTSKG